MHDGGNNMSDFCVADDLMEFNEVHRSQVIYTEFGIYRGSLLKTFNQKNRTPGDEPLLDPPGVELSAWSKISQARRRRFSRERLLQ